MEINEDDEYLIKLSAINGFTYHPKPIEIYIDSYGGHVYQCLGLLSIIQKSEVPIHTIVTGCAMSAGFLIAITGHKRFGHERSTFMYHQVSSGMGGKLKEMEEEVIEVKRLQRILEEHTLAKTKLSEKDLEKCYKEKNDWYFSSKQALKHGIIDEII